MWTAAFVRMCRLIRVGPIRALALPSRDARNIDYVIGNREIKTSTSILYC